ncbi:PAS domain S-box protein [Leptolyngbya iicbica]|uniref:Circadian input-output histidine kinase CikA n=2 Tax=Cyanophyceae TaxID=3028117 RepID=A0A4Q7E6L6_9CYAN|nr:PAS domain S-box protein [Leptolyngbya sp. LK]RZM77901.1 PAS domain S-box protein [Leptolyngbya sp. LK]
MNTLWVVASSETVSNTYRRWMLEEPLGKTTVEVVHTIAADTTSPLWDLIILDAGVGADSTQPVRQSLLQADVPVLVVAAPHEEAIALELLRQGAQDYIIDLSEQSYDGLVYKAQQLTAAQAPPTRAERSPSMPLAEHVRDQPVSAVVADIAAVAATSLQLLQIGLEADQIRLVRGGLGAPGEVIAAAQPTTSGVSLGQLASYFDGQLHETDAPSKSTDASDAALLVVPIYQSGVFWGAWVVEQWSRSRSWQSQDLALLQLAAQQIAQWLQSQELAQQAHRERARHNDAIAALADTTEMYASILRNISDAVFITDHAGKFTFICPNVATIFGYNQADVVAMGSIDQLLGDDLCEPSELQARQELTNLECRINDQSGRTHDLLINVKRVDIGQGSRLYTCRDVSDRKQAETQLHQSETDYRRLVDNIPAGVVVHDGNTEILTCNHRASELLELSLAQMQGKTSLDPAWSFLQEDGTPLSPADFPVNRVVATGQPLENWVIGVNRPVSQTQIWALVNAYPTFKRDRTLDQIIVVFVEITAQKQAQIALAASERRYASLAQAAPVGIFRTDSEGHCVYVNDRWSDIAGMTLAQAQGFGWVEGLHPEDRDAITAEWYDAAQNNRPFSLEYRFLSPAQETTWVYGQAVAETDIEGQITGYIGTVTDITERHQAEAQLKASEERYRLLFNIANDLILMHPLGTPEQPGQRFIHVNAMACERLGYTQAELQQLTPLDLIPPGEMDEVPAELDILTTNGQLLFEKTLIAKDGRHIPVELHAHVFEWDGQPMVLSIARDISERKVVQDQLKARERLFRATFDQSAVAMAMEFIDGHFVRVNQKMCDLLGYTEAELLELHAAHLRHPDYRAAALNITEQLLAGEVSLWQGDEQFLNKAGQPVWINTCISLIRDTDGRPDYFLSVMQDVGDRIQAHAALQASEVLFRNTFEQAAVGVAHVSPTGNFVRLNQRFCDILGYPHDELIGLTFQDITHPDDLTVDLKQVQNLLSGAANTYSLEKRYIHQTGSIVWVNLTVALVRNAEAAPDYFIAVVQDISALKATEERLSLALSSANQGIYDLNLKTDEAIVGREYALMLGYDPDHFAETVTSWRQRVHPEDQAAVKAAYQAYAEGQTPNYRVEFRMLTCQHTWKWVLSVGKFVDWDVDGNPTRLLGTHTDIDDRKQAELELQALNQTLEHRVLRRTQDLTAVNRQLKTQAAALHQANQLLQTVMDSIPQRIFWTDRNSILLGCNRQFAADRGLTVEAAIGRNNHEVSATPEEADLFDVGDRQVMESGEPNLHVQETWRRADGVLLHLDTSKVPLRNEAGEVIGLLGCYEDITQRKVMENRIQQQLQKERLLSSLQQQMRETLDLQEILDLTVQQVQQLLKIHRVLIYQIDEHRQGQVMAEATGCECFPVSLQGATNHLTISEACYRQYLPGKAQAIADMRQEDVSECMQLLTQQTPGVVGEIMVPIVEHGGHRVWGLLIGHQCERPRQWQRWERQFLEQLSSHLAIAIHQICLYEQLQAELQQRQQIEKSLRASEARLQLVTDSVNGCIAYVDAEQRYQFINHTFEAWFGWEKANIIGRTVKSIIGAAAYDATRNYITRALAGEPVTYEAALPYQRGGVRHVIASLVPEIDEQRQVHGYYVLITDISDRKAAELALQESRHFIEQIANASPNAIYLYDLIEQRNLYVNREIGAMLGYSPDEIQAMGAQLLSRLMHPDDWRRYQAYCQQLMGAQDGEVLEFEYRMRHQEGNWHWLNSRDSIFARNEQGQATQIIGSAQDITDRKQAEALIQAQAKREKLLREITQRIRSTLELATIFTTACDEIRQALQCDRVGVFQFDPAAGYTVGEFVAESTGADMASTLHVTIEEPCFAEAYAEQYRRGRYFIANNIYEADISNCHAGILELFQIHACMVMPLLEGEALWGLLCIHECQAPRDWQTAEIDLVHQLAAQIAIALRQAKFYTQTQAELSVRKQAERQIARQLREQQTLAAITQITRESLNVADILESIAAQVKEILNGDRVIIFRLFDDGRTRIIEEAVGPDLPQLKDQQWNDEVWSQDILERYWRGEPRQVPDVMDDIWTECLQAYAQSGQIRSKLVAPILQHDAAVEMNRWTCPETHTKIWGLLVVHACVAPRQWKDSEARLLQQIADQLAIAMRQAGLFERLQTELQERQHAQNLLTERNQQLATSNEQLAHATRMKDEFLANVSHEIRTPMNAIIGMTQLTLETSLTARQRNYLTKIDKSATTLLHIINDILDFSKIEADKLELEVVPFALDEVLSNLADVIGVQASHQGLELLFHVALDTPLQLVGDPFRLGQILLNLVSNAIKFTAQGHVLVAVRVEQANETSCRLRFAVTDTGIGLSAAQQAKLFQAFAQGDASTTRKFGGTGLGLVISQRLAHLMQGEIGLESTLGQGSTFWLTATFQLATACPNALLTQCELPTALQGIRVLAVDDNAAARTIFHEVLSSFQFEPTVVATAAEAIAAIAAAETAQQPFEVVIVDYVMPDIDGIALIQQIHRTYPTAIGPAILLVTAHRQRVVQESAQAAGINHLLYKPLQPSQLLEAIVEAVLPGQATVTVPAVPSLALPSPGALAQVRVLLVEDHEINQELALEFLTQAGAIATVVDHGRAAIEALQQAPFDVVLMDCQMPVMDGYEATRHIRALPGAVSQVPIIAMTANAMQGDRQKCLAIGMNDYLAKPIVKAEMYAAIQRWVPSEQVPSSRSTRSMHALPISPVPAAFTHLNSFNIEQGLQYVGENLDLYIKLLQQFLSKNQTFVEQFQQHIDQEDYVTATRLVHNLKSTAATLGCAALKNPAQTLEQSLLQHPQNYDADSFTAVVDILATVLNELTTWQASYHQPQLPEETLDDLDWSVVLQQVQQMQTALDSDLVAALEHLKYLQEVLQNHHSTRQIVNTLARSLDDFEIDRAQTTLQTLAQFANSRIPHG